ncbi:hypothetical protein [Sandaracinobacter sp.]|jgi:hypothetical protein|uniref:hypothetical protein n=1 Tax=Sandaracinobacter sp. TaxID=2487581 RepID=UPI0035AED0E9
MSAAENKVATPARNLSAAVYELTMAQTLQRSHQDLLDVLYEQVDVVRLNGHPSLAAHLHDMLGHAQNLNRMAGEKMAEALAHIGEI